MTDSAKDSMDRSIGALGERGIDIRSDFHVLTPFQVERVLEEADHVRYRRPKNANGSRARYFFARLQRHYRAERKG